MRKKIVVFAALAIVFAAGSFAVVTPSVEASARRVDYIAYVEENDAPVIDGTIDDVWKDAGTLQTNAANSVFGYATVLWNEDGMYYLGYVNDSTICNKDACAFWISEDYELNNRWLEYPFYTNQDFGYAADGKAGAYSIMVHPNGTAEISCTASEKYSDIQVAASKDEKSGAWIAEVFVPHIGEKTVLAEYKKIGFEFSIDNYDSTSDTSASTVKWMWNYNWPYRTNYTALGKLILSKANEETSAAAVAEPEVEEKTENVIPTAATGSETTEESGCGSTIATVGIGAILGGVFVFFKKKRD